MAASDAIDHYAVLGVAETATAAEIRSAYLRLARAHHPDFHEAGEESARDANEREMQRINPAWTILGDGAARAAYDQRRRSVAGPGSTARGPQPAQYDFVPYDDDDTDYAALIDDAVEGTELPRWVQLTPALLLLAGIGSIILGAVIALSFLISLGVVAVVFGLLGFLAAPAMAVSRSRRTERRD